MIKRNNKGFTLLELLISIFILTTVIFLGYRVINKSTIDIKNQSNINQGQLTVNDMNEYLTKDLEQASNVLISSNYLTQKNILTDDSTQENKITNENLKETFINYSGDKPFDYSYNINYKENNFGVIYEVNITKKDENNYNYTIKRTDKKDGISITFINDEIIKKDEILEKSSTNIEIQLPFEISLDSPYKVCLGYNGKNNEFIRHEFTVSYRLNEVSLGSAGSEDGENKPPSVDEIQPPKEWEDEINKVIDYNAIGFWTLDSNEKKEDNLYTWVSTDGKILGEAYANQEDGKNDKFNIEGNARPGNNADTSSYIGYKTMANDIDWEGQVKGVSIGDKDISKISIYVSEGTTLENFTIKTTQGNSNIQIDKTLKSGWHHCVIDKNNKSKINFEFTGNLSIDKNEVTSGYAYVVYEREDSSSDGNTSDLRGDLILEITKNNSQNTGQYNWEEIIKGNLVQNPVIGVQQSLTEFKDRPFHLYIGKHENKIRPAIDGMGYDIYNSKICNIVGMRVRLDGDIKLKFDNFYDKENNSILDNPQKVYEFELPNKDYNISGKIDILKNVPLYNTSRIIVDFIYK